MGPLIVLTRLLLRSKLEDSGVMCARQGRRMEEYGREAGFGVAAVKGMKGWRGVCSDRIFPPYVRGTYIHTNY